MRLFAVPILSLALAAAVISMPSRAEGDALARQAPVRQPVALEGTAFKRVEATSLPVAAAKKIAVTNAGGQLVASTGRPAPSDGALRNSVLMLLLPGLCCR